MLVKKLKCFRIIYNTGILFHITTTTTVLFSLPLQVLLLHSLTLPLSLLFSSFFPSRCCSSILSPYHYCSLPLQVLLLHSLTLPLLFSSPRGASPPFSHLTTTTTVLFFLPLQVLLLHSLTLPLLSSSPPGAPPPFSHLTTTVLFHSRCFSSILSSYHCCSLPLQVLLLHSLTLPLLFSSTPGASPPFSHLTTTILFSLPSKCFSSILSPYHYWFFFLPLQVLLPHSLTLPLLFSSPPGASPPFSHLTTTVLSSPPGASPPFSYLSTTTTVLFSLPSRCFSSILSPYHYHYCSLLSSPPGASPPFSHLTTTVLFPSRCFSSILSPYHYCSLPLQVLLLHSLTLPLLFSSPPGSSPPFSHLTTTVLFPSRCFSSILSPYRYCSLPLEVLLLHSLTLPLPLLFSSFFPSRCFSSILSPYHYCPLPLQVLLLHSLTLPLLFSSPPGAPPPFSHLTTTVLFHSRCLSSILSSYHCCSLPLQVLLLHSLTLPLLFSSTPGASPPFSHLTTTVLFSLPSKCFSSILSPYHYCFLLSSPPGSSPPFSYLTATVLFPSRCFSSILSPYHYCSLFPSRCFSPILLPFHYHYCSLLSPLQVLLLHSLTLPLLFSSFFPSRFFSPILSPYRYCPLPLQVLLPHSLTLPLPLLFSSFFPSRCFSSILSPYHCCSLPLQVLLLHSLTLPLLFSSPPGAPPPFSHLTTTVLFHSRCFSPTLSPYHYCSLFPSRCFSPILLPYHYHYCSLLSPLSASPPFSHLTTTVLFFLPLQVLLPHSLTLPLLFSSPPGASPPFSHLTTTTTVLFFLPLQVLLPHSLTLPLLSSSTPGASPPFSHLTATVLFPSRCFSSILSPYHYCSLPLQVLLLHSLTLPLPLLFSSFFPSRFFSPILSPYRYCSLPLQVLLLHSLTLPLLFSSPPGASPPFSHLTTTVLFPSRCFSSILSPYPYHYCSLPLQVLLLHSLTLPLLFSLPLQVLLLHSLTLPLLFSSPPGASPPFSHLTTTVLFPSRCFSSILSPYHYCSLPL